MIRLIASDIDGTLLPYDETVMPQRLFPLIRRLPGAEYPVLSRLRPAVPLHAHAVRPRGGRDVLSV